MACGGPKELAPPAQATLQILSVDAPEPVLEGSRLRIMARGLSASASALLQVGTEAQPTLGLLSGEPDLEEPGRYDFELSRDVVRALGDGEHALRLVLTSGTERSLPFVMPLEVAAALPVGFDEITEGAVYREALLIVRGRGFLGEGEGEVVARVHGNFTAEAQETVAVTAELPLAPTEDRERTTMRLTTALGGPGPGRFEGTVQLVSTLRSGEQSTSGVQNVSWEVRPPEVFALPASVALGEVSVVTGAGFLGAPGVSGEATILRFEGTLDADGEARAVTGLELVAPFVSGQEVQLTIDFEAREGQLVSSAFGVPRGLFKGQIQPVTLSGVEVVEGPPLDVELRLSGPRQVVMVRFLPGFNDSLQAFGLALARDVLVDRVLARLSQIYSDYRVSFVLEGAPVDALPEAVATLDIGGPDPNGLGAFGYDNTPGKDVGNLRLNDQIGGKNAITRQDGSPGYGGVFVESFLWWSSHPELPGERPDNAPPPDELFDAVFDPVRASPVSLTEATSDGSDPRGLAVGRAIRALSSLIGETAAHELGHSLGLADPYGNKSTFHNPMPGEGCLMDSGVARPLGERMAEPGYAQTRFCGDAPGYLSDILPP